MISVELDLVAELEAELLRMSHELGKPVARVVERAVKNMLEDREDILAAQASAAEGGPTYSMADVWQYLEANCGVDGKFLDGERLI